MSVATGGVGLRDLVLVADSDAERAERMASACAARGIEVEVATHGARALELALTELPVAIVAQLDLPLIEGTRLAEILRANPRTQSIGILFIADERAVRPGGDAAGRVLPGSSDPETIVHFVEALLLKHRPRREAPAEPIGGIEGELGQISLSELIELFHVNRKTGRIVLERGPARRRETGEVVLRDGDVVHASSGAVIGEKALYRLFAWERGHFSFVPDPTTGEVSVERPTRALLREGRRQAAEWGQLVEEVPPHHTRIQLVVSRSRLPSVLHPLTQEVLMLLEQTDRVEEVLDRCSFPDYQVLRTLTTLVRRRIVELHHESDEARQNGASLVPPALVGRLRERIERQRGYPDAKVLVFGSGEDALQALATLLARLPGAEPPPPLVPQAMSPLARLAIDEEVGVEWWSAPPSRTFSAIWPLAAHGALAVVFVHAGPLETSVDVLRSAIDRVGSLPRTRVLHALLAEKSGSEAVPGLCEALSLFDDRGVVEIPLSAPGPAEEALRELLLGVLE